MKAIGLTFILGLGLTEGAIAQVIPDSTVGTTIVSPTNLIDGGTRSGNNLFHSFSQFSIPTNGSAIFNNPTDIQNIFSRVTGTTQSSIDGLIKTQGNANLFLMNPNGIVFGPSTKLDIGGSFIGTTANSVKFADGVQFSSSDTTLNPLLTVSLPIGLQMGSNSGAISLQGGGHTLTTILPRTIPVPTIRDPMNTGMALTSGKTVALIGSYVGLMGGVLTADQGQIELGAVRSGTVGLNLQPDQNLRFNYAPVNTFPNTPPNTSPNTYGEIRLDNRSLLDVSGIQGGAIHLQGQNLNFTSGSMVLNQNDGSQMAGTIRLDAIDRIHLQDATPATQTAIFSESLGSGQGGMLEINAKQLTLDTGAVVGSSSYGNGRSGLLEIQVSEKIQIRGFAPSAPFLLSGIGNSTYAQGLGSVTRLKTQRLEILEGGALSASVLGINRGSDLMVEAGEILLSGVNPVIRLPSTIGATVFGTGSGGNITIQSDRIVLREGDIGSSTLSKGSAGNLTINATQSIEVNGRSSTINSAAAQLNEILQKVFGLPAIPTGNSGDLKVTTPQLRVLNGGGISVYSDGPGSAGNLRVVADSIFLNQAGTITASTVSGNGGDIRLDVGSAVILRNGSTIATNSQGMGNGGSIFINSPTITGLGNSDIIANAITGQGGKIQITTQGIFGLKYRDRITSENDITASSEFGINGTVQVNSLGLDPSSGLVKLNGDVIDSSRSIAKGCSGNQGNSFVSTGRGGIPQGPLKRGMTDRSWHDLRGPITSTSVAVIQSSAFKLVEATRIQTLADGSIALIDGNSVSLGNNATCAIAP